MQLIYKLARKYVPCTKIMYALTAVSMITGLYSLWVHSTQSSAMSPRVYADTKMMIGDSNRLEACVRNGLEHLLNGPSRIHQNLDGNVMVQRIVIVEERQQAVKYWFEETNNGHIPKERLTLLYIGDHLVGETPSLLDSAYLTNVPGRYFHNINNTSQQHDVITSVFALTMLFERIIWVWSTPGDTNPNESIRYDRFSVLSGLNTSYDYVRKTEQKNLCICAVIASEDRPICRVRSGQLNSNHVVRTLFDVITNHGQAIEASECHFEHATRVEIVREHMAIRKLRTGEWIKRDESTIVNVDQNFYGGMMSTGQEMMNSGLTIDSMDSIDKHVSGIICIVRNSSLERIADKFLTHLVRLVYQYINCSACNKRGKLGTELYIKVVLEQRRTDGFSMFCNASNLDYLKGAVSNLSNLLTKLDVKMVQAVAKTGFCFSRTRNTFKLGSRFALCRGNNNIPSPTLAGLQLHMKEWIQNRTTVLLQLLDGKYIQPGLVSITRSIREGSILRDYADLVEQDVLCTVYNMIGVEDTLPVYDKDLLWGRGGVGKRKDELHL